MTTVSWFGVSGNSLRGISARRRSTSSAPRGRFCLVPTLGQLQKAVDEGGCPGTK